MKGVRVALAILTLCVLTGDGIANPSGIPKRIALVIATNISVCFKPNANSKVDAQLASAALKNAGFQVRIVENATRRDMLEAIQSFAEAAKQADVAAVYATGLGGALGRNVYLFPTDFVFPDSRCPVSHAVPQTIEFVSTSNLAATFASQAVNETELVRAAQAAQRVAIISLDVGREDALPTFHRSPNEPDAAPTAPPTRSLSFVGRMDEPTTETFTIYSSGVGKSAADGNPGEGSPFALAFAKHIAAPGDIVRVLGSIADAVRAATKDGQRPMIEISNVSGTPYCLVRCDGAGAASESPPLKNVGKPECRGDWTAPKDGREVRYALVIAESAYTGSGLGRLSATAQDADNIESGLIAANFSVRVCNNLGLTEFHTELSNFVAATEGAVRQWKKNGRPDDTAPSGFFYFSGHGASSVTLQANYLIPVGQDIRFASQLADDAVRISDIADGLSSTGARAVFIVADACRGALPESETKAVSQGFLSESQRSGVLIAFSTEPGQLALDQNLYSSALEAGLKQRPGEDARLVFGDVRDAMMKTPGNNQKPWVEAGGMNGRYYFQPH